jgi:hypothetical protein
MDAGDEELRSGRNSRSTPTWKSGSRFRDWERSALKNRVEELPIDVDRCTVTAARNVTNQIPD